jgi:hypothetical protein
MVVLDNTVLSLLLYEKAKPPEDPATGKPLTYVAERMDLLIETWDLDSETVLIPAPALSEFLVIAANDGPKYLAEIKANHLYEVADFDTKAAIECAALNLAIMTSRDKKEAKRGSGTITWAKVAFDRQIVAIAKSRGAHTIYSDDRDIMNFASRFRIKVVRTWELPMRPERLLPFPEPSTDAEEDPSAPKG